MTKNDKQQDLFARQRKGNQTKEILTSIDIGSDKIVCLIAKSDQVTREKRAIRVIGSGYCQSKGIRNGRIFDANEAEKSIRLALDKAEKTANIEGVLNQKTLSIEEGARLKIKTETYK